MSSAEEIGNNPQAGMSGSLEGAGGAALEEGEFRTVFDAVPLAMVVVDEGCVVRRVNVAAVAMCGGDKAEKRVGQALGCLSHLKSAHGCGLGPFCGECRLRQSVLHTIGTGERRTGVDVKLILQRSEGSVPEVRHLVVTTTPLEVGERRMTLVCMEDVTARRATEKALRLSEERFSSAFYMSPDAININRLEDGVYLDINESFTTITGHTRSDVLGRSSRPEGVNIWVHPEDRVKLVDGLKATGEVTGLEAEFRRKDGSVLTGLMSAKLLEFDGQPCILSITRDMTERKHLEEQLRQAQKMEAIGRLAGGIAHDFRNQLAVIRASVELMQSHQPVSPQGKAWLGEIMTAASQSTRLTEQLLLFGRRQTLQAKEVDIGELAGEICGILPRLVGEDIRVTYQRDPGPMVALIDAVQFQQALFNLAANARDAMPEGGELRIRLSHFVPDGHFKERHPGAAGEYLALEVTDTGPGIDEATRARIFEPFFTTKAVGKGTGLGLASVYGFVKQSGGIVEVASPPGAGATFRLYFRRVAGVSSLMPAAVGTSEVTRSGAGRGRILVVDDHHAIQGVVAYFLQAGGYEAVVAGSAEEALRVLVNAGEAVDLMISDITMPGVSGVELARRARKVRPGLGVVLMSAYVDKELLERGLEETGALFLAKPFQRAELLDVVRRGLEGRGGG